jgi:hypothetical protein
MYLRNLTAIASPARSRACPRPSLPSIDLEQTEQDEDQRHERERQNAVSPSRDLLKGAEQPADVEVVRQYAGHEDVVPLEPTGDLGVQCLKARGIAEQPMADDAETPDRRPGQHGDDHDGRQQGEGQRQQLRHPGLQIPLQGPDDCNDEQRKGDGCENRAGEIEGGKNQDGGAEAKQGLDRAVAGH